MTGTRKPISLLPPALLAGALLFSLSCLDEGPVLEPSEAKNDEARVQECESILGQAFASAEQRQWFIDNCSSWPQRDPPQVVKAAPVATDTPECAEIRGKPYESPEQRRWFLANCVADSTATEPSRPSAEQSTGDRRDCEEIRGTQYRSPTERQWFLANCLTSVGEPDDRDDDDDDDRPGNRGNGRGRGGGDD